MTKPLTLILVLLASSSISGFAQKKFDQATITAIEKSKKKINGYEDSGNYETAKDEAKNLLTLLIESGHEESIHTLYALNDIGRNFMDMGNRDSAVFYAEKALSLSKKNIGTESSMDDIVERGSAYSFMAELAYFGGQYLESTQYLEDQIKFYESTSLDANELMKRPLMHLGIVYSGLGLMDKSMRSYDKARAIEEAKEDEADPGFLGTVYVNIASCYAYMNILPEALNYTLKAIDLYKNVPGLRNELADLYSSTATTYSNLNQMDSARAHLEKALTYNKQFPTSLYNQSAIASKIAATHLNLGNYDEAIQYSREGLEMKRQLYGPSSPVITYDYIRFGKIYIEKNDLKTAKAYLDSATYANTNPVGDPFDPYLTISINTVNMALLKKLFDRDNSPQQAKDLFAFIETQNAGINEFRRKMTGELSKTTSAASFYSESVDICYKMYLATDESKWAQLAFLMSETNKSLLLYDFITNAEQLNQAGLSQETIDQKDSLKQIASLLESEIEGLKAQDSSKQELITKISELESIQKSYDLLLDEIRSSNPSFYEYKYAGQSLDLASIQRILKTEERQLISYHQVGTDLFCFVLSPDGLEMSRTYWDYKLESQVIRFRDLIAENGAVEEIDALSGNLYSKLIEPVKGFLIQKNITIIPEGVLSYLPFDLLKVADFADPLIFELNISYDFSAFLFQHFRQFDAAPMKGLLALAPSFQTENQTKDAIRSSIVALPGAQLEVDRIGKIFQSVVLKGDKATEVEFKKRAIDFGILHLATHAIIDDLSPGFTRLVFDLENGEAEDGYLHAHEIYNMKINADLITLSACNTGYGKIQKGEGVMSLSRAFAYAGSPNSLVSLWPASDKSSPEIMEKFYRNLADGQPKDVALNNAKRSYLSSAQGKARHPFYWGGFVLIGDSNPIEDDTNLLVYVIPSVLVVVMILTVYQRRKKALKA